MNILGISAYYHDSAAAIIRNGEIIAAAEEERFTRIKHDSSFPQHAISWCLAEASINMDQVEAIAFYDKPLLKFERLLETYYRVAPKGYFSFIKSIPVWINEKLFFKRNIHKNLRAIGSYDKKKIKLFFPEHHLSHAASAFYPSRFESSAILTIDGVGEWATASIALGDGNAITVLKEMHFPHSVGMLYSSFTYYLGFKVNSGEYKLMGLAPYGDRTSVQTKEFTAIIRDKLCTIYEDGSICLNEEFFTYSSRLRMVNEKKMKDLFGFSARPGESSIEQHHCNLALAVQMITEEIVLKMALHAKQLTGSENLCMAGGVALNGVANGKLYQSGIFKNIFIQPAAGDAGGAIGAALTAWYLFYQEQRTIPTGYDSMRGALLGPSFHQDDIEKRLAPYHAVYKCADNFTALANQTADLLGDGKVVGWFQGRMEFGPRALGNRSILADPRREDIQKRLNLKIKYRESFRPFAPAVLAGDVQLYFDFDDVSPYMLFVRPVARHLALPMPNNYNALPIWEKLYRKRSSLPAITHVDMSARIQTVHENTNPRFYELLTAFKKITGISVLVNTSMNVRGEPMVCTPEEAYACFMQTEMDVLVINNFIFLKENQPVYKAVSKPKKRND